MSFKTRSEHAIGSLRTLSGLLMIINFFLLLMTFSIVFTWYIQVILEVDSKKTNALTAPPPSVSTTPLLSTTTASLSSTTPAPLLATIPTPLNPNKKKLEDVTLYFCAALGAPLICALLIYMKELCNKDVPVPHGLAAIFMMIMCLVFGGLIIASGVFVLLKLPFDDAGCLNLNCKQLFCGTIMSFINAIGIIGQSFIHFTEKNIIMTYV